jgi:uncharacterized protein YvpB
MRLDAELHSRLITIAKTIASESGWHFEEPVDITDSVESGEPVWVIRSNCFSRGRNVRIVLRKADQSLVSSAFLPR